MKILVTGAHFTPAQATIEAILKMTQAEIVYIGRAYTREGDKSPSVESQVLPKLDVKFISLTAGRLQRTFTVHTIPSLLKIPIGFAQAFYYLLKEKPDVVLSFGGYIGVPIVIVAWLFSIPIIIHEQTLVSGLASRVTSWFASKVAVTFADQKVFPKEKVVVTGNPMRLELTQELKVSGKLVSFISEAKRRKFPLILVTGGNQGAHFINELVRNSLDELLKRAFVIHQVGNSKYNDIETIQESLANIDGSKNYFPQTFFDGREMGYIYRSIDLAVSRGGINTLLELSYFKVPTIIIPIENHKEQIANAKYFKNLNLAEILDQKEAESKRFLELVERMLAERIELRRKSKNSQKVIIQDAADRLALETLLLG